ncbi:MAG: dihydrofolate reductase [Saprospiraceae bacterium]|nr:dihydrofolate reductase [Saprospiraceae bacterium]
MIISAIVAVAENGVMGNHGEIPWHLSSDFKFFKKTTLHHPVIMGRSTFLSIGRPLPKRDNIIITRDWFYLVSGAMVVHSIEEALRLAESTGTDEAFIIGGGNIFRQTIDLWDKLYYTEIHLLPEGDTYFPEINWSDWNLIERRYQPQLKGDDCDCTFKIFQRKTESHRVTDI